MWRGGGGPSGCLWFGFLRLSVIREQNWVTVAVVGCPSWPKGSGTVGLLRRHSTSWALDTPPKLGEAAFCFGLTQTGRMNAPFCLLPFSVTPLPRALSQQAWAIVTCPVLLTPLLLLELTQPIYLRKHSHSSLGSTHWPPSSSVLTPACTPLKQEPSQIQHQLAMTSCLVAGGNETAWTWLL